nr:MFS transporter [Nocardioides gansuensis]
MSLNVKPSSSIATSRPLAPVTLGTALVLVTYVTPMATIPATAADLGAGPAARAWILSSMSLGLAAALLASGVMGDILGRRRVYVAGSIAMALAAAVCAVAQEPIVFIAARVVEGVGGAAVLACGLAVLAHRYPPGPERIHATSVWAASVGLGIAAGAVLAPALDVGSGWREAYAVTAVLGLALVLPSLLRIEESAAAAPRNLDLAGSGLLIAAMTLGVSALTQGRGGVDVPTVALAVLSAVSFVAFVLVERRVDQPLLDPALLRHPRFRAATGGSFVLGAGIIGMAAFIPTVAQVGLGRGLWAASLPVLAWAGVSVVTSMLARHVPHPLEGSRPIATLLVLVAGGQLLSYGLQADSSMWRLVVAMVVAGVGMGVLNAVLGREAIASVPPASAGTGSGANQTARYLGAACGITLFVTVATHAGDTIIDGWNTAVLVSATLTLVGAAAIALTGRTSHAHRTESH